LESAGFFTRANYISRSTRPSPRIVALRVKASLIGIAFIAAATLSGSSVPACLKLAAHVPDWGSTSEL